MSLHTEPAMNRFPRPGPDVAIVGQTPLSFLGSRSAAQVVAAAVSVTHRSIEMADEQCDGTGDDVEILRAIAALP